MALKNVGLLVGYGAYLWFMHTLWKTEPAFLNPKVAGFGVVCAALVTVVLMCRVSGGSR